MKYTSIAILALLGSADAHRHHHHRQSLAQGDVTPDSNRAVFDAAVAHASKVVNTENTSESGRTSTHADAMASQYKATYDKNAATRTKRVVEGIENNVAHSQWVVRNNRSNWAQISNPDANRAVFDSSVDTAASVVAKQKAMMAASDSSIAKSQADQAASTTAKKNGIVASRMNQIRNEVKKSRDSKGWRLVWPVNNYNYSTLAQEEPAKEAPAKEAPAKEAPAKEEPAKEAPAKEAPAKEAPAKEAPAKEAPAKEEPAKEAPAKEAPAKEAPAKEAPAKEAPAKDAGAPESTQQAPQGNPENAYKVKNAAVEEAAKVVDIQGKSETDHTDRIAASHADATSAAAAEETKAKQDINYNNQRNTVRPARDALGWRMQMNEADTINPAGYNDKVAAFVKPNIVYQSNDVSHVKW